MNDIKKRILEVIALLPELERVKRDKLRTHYNEPDRFSEKRIINETAYIVSLDRLSRAHREIYRLQHSFLSENGLLIPGQLTCEHEEV